MAQTAKKIIFSGSVQGVGFRFTALSVADRNQLTGQVRNVFDGTVEMIIQGDPEDINDCIHDLKEAYPNNNITAAARDIPFDPKYKDFKITF